MNKKPINYKGKDFPTITSFAKHHNVSPDLVMQRLLKGYSLEEAISQKSLCKVPIIVEGVEYPSVSEACRHYGFDTKQKIKLVEGRLKNDWTINQAFGLEERSKPENGPRSKSVTVHGVTYPSHRKLAEAYGITHNMLQHRVLTLKMSFEEAVSFDKVREITCFGKTYPSKAALAKEYNINVFTLVNRTQLGMSLEKAVSTPICYRDLENGGRIYKITHKLSPDSPWWKGEGSVRPYVGQTELTLDARFQLHIKASKNKNKNKKYKKNGLKPALLNFPIEDFTIEEICRAETQEELDALEQKYIEELSLYPKGYNLTKGGTVSSRKSHKVIVFNKTFESLAAACRHYNINEGTVSNRRKKGLSLEDALTLEIDQSKLPVALEIFGIKYPSLQQAAIQNNACPKAVWHQFKNNNRPLEEVIKELSGKSKFISVFGVNYKSKKDACDAHNVKVATISWRMKHKNMTLEEAIKTPNMKNQFG